MIRFRTATIAFSLAFSFAAVSAAWDDEAPAGVWPISEVIAKAERNQYVVVEGRVADVQIGDGSATIVRFEDPTGSLYLVVPNYLQRQFVGGKSTGGAGPTGAEPQIGVYARVGGQWNQKPLGEGWGIQVQSAERVEE